MERKVNSILDCARELFRLNQVRSLVETATLSWKSLTLKQSHWLID